MALSTVGINKALIDQLPELFAKATRAYARTGKDLGSKGSVDLKVDYDLGVGGRTNITLNLAGSVDTQAYLALLAQFASEASKDPGTFLNKFGKDPSLDEFGKDPSPAA